MCDDLRIKLGYIKQTRGGNLDETPTFNPLTLISCSRFFTSVSYENF